MAIALNPELIQRLKSTASEQQRIEFDVELARGVAALSLLKTAVEEMPIPQDASGYCAIEALCYLFGPESLPKDPFELRDPKRFSEALRGEAMLGLQQETLTCAIPADPTELFAMVREENFYGGISLEEGEANLHVNLILPGIGGLLLNEPRSMEDVLSLVQTNDDFLCHSPKHIFGKSLGLKNDNHQPDRTILLFFMNDQAR